MYTLGYKDYVVTRTGADINTISLFSLDVNGNRVTAPVDTATIVELKGFGTFEASKVSNIKLTRGIASRVQTTQFSLDPNPAITTEKFVLVEATGANVFSNSSFVTVVIDAVDFSQRGEFAQNQYNFGRTFKIQVPWNASTFKTPAAANTDSAAGGQAFWEAVIAQVDTLKSISGGEFPLTITRDANIVTITVKDSELSIKSIKFMDEESYATSPFVAINTIVVGESVAPADIATPSFEGLNTGKFIRESVRVFTDETRRPFNPSSDEYNVNDGDLFASVTFDYTYIKENDNLVIDAIHSARTKFQVYFKENGLGSTSVTNFVYALSGGLTAAGLATGANRKVRAFNNVLTNGIPTEITAANDGASIVAFATTTLPALS
jgi:hypothetical protein